MKSLYSRIVVTMLVVILSSSLLGFFFANIYYQIKLKPFNDEKTAKIAEEVQQFYQSNRAISLKDYLENVGELGYELYLTDGKDQSSYFGGAFRKKDLPNKTVQQVLAGETYHGIDTFDTGIFITGFFDNDVRNTIGVPVKADGEQLALFIRQDPEQQFGELRIFFAMILVFTSIISILFVLISGRYIVKPVVKLTNATKKIRRGNYDVALEVRRKDEIGQLADSFAKMASELEKSEAARQEFVANVSHELQSPLTSMQGFARLLGSGTLTEKEQKEYLTVLSEETTRLSSLTKQLLTLASLDQESELRKKEPVQLAEQWRQLIQMTEWSWREKELTINLELADINYSGDAELLYQVWSNLLNNAIKYTPESGDIQVRLYEETTNVFVEVWNSGAGISKEDMAKIFDRFYKASQSRTREEGSSGLGLSICKKIITLHHGEISVESNTEKGTTFIVRLPKN
ncbi:TPA: HAMP domain-containing histidine kinase [Listeria innocua]|uniref:sensor histidine kinase n=1 Tax=Listeria innocua TaxID=1642 RepID=UPI00185DBF99|nr:HAMP domain-containing sensor histidine kinase [Listeria innocua]EIR7350052.1 HAMP domain-containing histidine kinase [Listeria innocua]EMD1122525.1 HAMP domain-containing histidine kinase [Listeria innocua]HBM3461758.1 HAMP domain-containing histidine kinase [Listeria innocua]HBM3523696.1 HAMP domain-containing histidine kinase [Listeria innocua]HBM3539605.1 HAMP domain-containing histidine kinase [Listeria innocua]